MQYRLMFWVFVSLLTIAHAGAMDQPVQGACAGASESSSALAVQQAGQVLSDAAAQWVADAYKEYLGANTVKPCLVYSHANGKPVNGVTWCRNGSCVVSYGVDGNIHWSPVRAGGGDPHTYTTPRPMLANYDRGVFAVTSDGQTVAYDTYGNVRLLRLTDTSDSLIDIQSRFPEEMSNAKFAHDSSRLLFTDDHGGKFGVFDPVLQKMPFLPVDHRITSPDFAISRDNTRIALAMRDHVKIIPIDQQGKPDVQQARAIPVKLASDKFFGLWSIASNDDCSACIAPDGRGNLYHVAIDRESSVDSIIDHMENSSFLNIALSADGRRAAYGFWPYGKGLPGIVVLDMLRSGKPIKTILTDPMSPVIDSSKSARVLDFSSLTSILAARQITGSFPHGIITMAMSPDGQSIAGGSVSGHVYVWGLKWLHGLTDGLQALNAEQKAFLERFYQACQADPHTNIRRNTAEYATALTLPAPIYYALSSHMQLELAQGELLDKSATGELLDHSDNNVHGVTQALVQSGHCDSWLVRPIRELLNVPVSANWSSFDAHLRTLPCATLLDLLLITRRAARGIKTTLFNFARADGTIVDSAPLKRWKALPQSICDHVKSHVEIRTVQTPRYPSKQSINSLLTELGALYRQCQHQTGAEYRVYENDLKEQVAALRMTMSAQAMNPYRLERQLRELRVIMRDINSHM